jgi:hypothetical protein
VDEVSGRTLRVGAAAVALASAAFAGALPLLATGDALSPAGALALAGSLLAAQAVAFAPAILPVALVLYAAECVLAAETAGLSSWVVPPFAVALLLFAEAAAVRERTPVEAHVERPALRLAAWQLVVSGALGLAGAAAASAASTVSTRGGAVAGILGGTAVSAALLLVAGLGRLEGASAGKNPRGR